MPRASSKRAGKSDGSVGQAKLQSTQDSKSQYWAWALVGVVVLFTAAIRIRLLQMPLERDEGEFAYMGQLILQGIPPYALAYNMKLPGIYAAYALVMAVFGQTAAGIHIGLILANSASTVLLFLLARRLFDPLTGVVACASFALHSVSPSVLGTSAHATQFLLPFALGGILLLLKAIDSSRPGTLFLSGLLLGLAFIIKQHAVFFVIFGLLYLVWSQMRTRPVAWKDTTRKAALFALGAAIPFGLSCLILYAAGVFERFWFWTFTYALKYATEMPRSLALKSFSFGASRAMGVFVRLWIIAGVGLTALAWDKKARANSIFLVGFVVFSFLTVCPGFYFTLHYFITFLPAMALLAGIAVSSTSRILSGARLPAMVQTAPLLLFAVVLAYAVFQHRTFFFKATPNEASRMMYGLNPFPECAEIARYIKTHSTERDSIAVLGSEPQIYFYSRRRSATGYIYTYGLMEKHEYALKMQREMIGQIESARPKYIVLVDIDSSWLVKPYSKTLIFNWVDAYCQQHYRVVGVADIVSEDCTLYYWDEEAENYQASSPCRLYLLERKAPLGE